MLGSVIQRLGHRIEDDGSIIYNERPATWDAANKLAGRQGTRRRCYAVINDDAGKPELCELVRWSDHCSGCTEVPEMTTGPERGYGCDECGYAARRRSTGSC